ncbi:hypothetical protein PTKIN_Ptkin02bG0240200 [Pterospermum kingtungense]
MEGVSVRKIKKICVFCGENSGKDVAFVNAAFHLGEVLVRETCGKEIKVATMHERLLTMMELSDAFIALPGGFGTLEELFQMISWAQLNIHSKPIGVLNINGFFNSLLSFVDMLWNRNSLHKRHERS